MFLMKKEKNDKSQLRSWDCSLLKMKLDFYTHCCVCYQNILAVGIHISLCEGF